MHIEKNFFDNIFNTVMDVKGKTKDNVKARMDLLEHYQGPELELCCTYISPNFSLYLIHFSWCFHVKCRWERVKFTSFESYCAYNVLCLTFKRNLWVLIESNTSRAISRKEQKSDRSPGGETKENQKSAQLCTARHDRAAVAATPYGCHDHTHGRACDRAPAQGVTRMAVRRPRHAWSRNFSTIYMGFSSFF